MEVKGIILMICKPIWARFKHLRATMGGSPSQKLIMLGSSPPRQLYIYIKEE